MLKDIIKKEILDHLLSAKFIFMFIICSVLILLSVYMGAVDYLTNKKTHEADEAQIMQALAPPNNWSTITDGALRVYRRPQTLSTLVKGVEDAAGRASYTHLPEVSLSESKHESNPLTSVFGAFDLMFIVKMVLSLFAILLMHDVICGEKEKGTLKLALSNSVPRDRLLLGKAVGGYISLCVPLVFPLLISLIYLSLHTGIDFSGEDWQRIGFIFLMFLLYLTVFFCLGLLVSSLTARSSTSLLILLSVWCVWGIILPKASVIIAGHLRSIPTANEIYTRKTAFVTQLNQEYVQNAAQKGAELGAKLWLKFNITSTDSPEYQEYLKELDELIQKVTKELYKERAGKIAENTSRIDRDFQREKDAQVALAKNLSRVSPASALTFSATALAQTGIDEYNRFLKATQEYKPVISNWVNTDPGIRNERGALKVIDSDALAAMPRLTVESERLSRTFVRILPDLISMIVMIALLTGGAYFAFIRCDVR